MTRTPMEMSRVIAFDRLSRVIPEDRARIKSGRWVKRMERMFPPFLLTPTCGGLWCGRPLSDLEVFAEAVRFYKPHYRWKERR